MNCEVYSSFKGLSSNYRIMSVNICLSLHRDKQIGKSLQHIGQHLPIEIYAVTIQ